MIHFCCDTRRRSATMASPLNGLDFVEVVDRDAPAPALRQRILIVHFLKDVAPLGLTSASFRIDGGSRISGIVVEAADPVPGQSNALALTLSMAGDFSIYTLAIQTSAIDPAPPPGFDPALAAVGFSFKAECPSPFDCAPVSVCKCPVEPLPPIDYLARDYASIRRAMLDRMAVLIPGWTERNAADLGVTLIELLATVGDDIAWRQDAAHTEAFLGRARLRSSVRRLARLVDYRVSDGANARTFVHLAVSANVGPANPGDPAAVPAGTAFTSRTAAPGARIEPTALADAAAVFEAMHDVPHLFAAHNRMAFHTFSDGRCMLPAGSTGAVLAGHFPRLMPGDVLILEEVIGPRTGNPADADPAKRHAVRLTMVEAFAGPDPLSDPVAGLPITGIAWHDEDALPFPLCLSSITDEAFGAVTIDEVSVARGNIVLADHGRSIGPEPLGEVPSGDLLLAAGCAPAPCASPDTPALPPRFRPLLAGGPITQARAFDPAAAGSAAAQRPSDGRATPRSLILTGALGPITEDWAAAPAGDLLNSGPFDRHLVAEVEADGSTRLRFGDDAHGRRPDAGTTFRARYRIGNGTAGNIGRDSLVATTLPHPEILLVRNPLAAIGGSEPESIAAIRQRAPFAYRRQERAVTRADYEEVPLRMGGIAASRGTWRHTGSWHSIFATPDRVGGLPVDSAFAAMLRGFLEPYRLAGRDLAVDQPRDVAIDLALAICVLPTAFRADIAAELAAIFSTDTRADGQLGLFHPDRLGFGQTLYLSPLVAAAQGVPGVASVEVIRFGRLADPQSDGIPEGLLRFDRLEIARLDNDRTFPERGQFRLALRGGK